MIFNKSSIVALLLSCSAMAQTPGVNIVYTITTDKNVNGSMNIYSQNGNSRMEMEMKMAGNVLGAYKMTSIVQVEKQGVTIQLNETNKTYTEQIVPAESGQTPESNECTVTVLGKEKVGEYNCIHVKVKQNKTEYEMWNTKDINPSPNYYKNNNKYTGNEKLRKALTEKQADGFPVKVVHNETGSHEGAVTLLVTKFEIMFVTPDKFQIPAGFTKTAANTVAPNMPSMPSQEEMMKMTPEEREKFIEQMKKQYGGGN